MSALAVISTQLNETASADEPEDLCHKQNVENVRFEIDSKNHINPESTTSGLHDQKFLSPI